MSVLLLRRPACHNLAVFSLIPAPLQMFRGVAVPRGQIEQGSQAPVADRDDLASSLGHNSLESASCRPGGAGQQDLCAL